MQDSFKASSLLDQQRRYQPEISRDGRSRDSSTNGSMLSLFRLSWTLQDARDASEDASILLVPMPKLIQVGSVPTSCVSPPTPLLNPGILQDPSRSFKCKMDSSADAGCSARCRRRQNKPKLTSDALLQIQRQLDKFKNKQRRSPTLPPFPSTSVSANNNHYNNNINNNNNSNNI